MADKLSLFQRLSPRVARSGLGQLSRCMLVAFSCLVCLHLILRCTANRLSRVSNNKLQVLSNARKHSRPACFICRLLLSAAFALSGHVSLLLSIPICQKDHVNWAECYALQMCVACPHDSCKGKVRFEYFGRGVSLHKFPTIRVSPYAGNLPRISLTIG